MEVIYKDMESSAVSAINPEDGTESYTLGKELCYQTEEIDQKGSYFSQKGRTQNLEDLLP